MTFELLLSIFQLDFKGFISFLVFLFNLLQVDLATTDFVALRKEGRGEVLWRYVHSFDTMKRTRINATPQRTSTSTLETDSIFSALASRSIEDAGADDLPVRLLCHSSTDNLQGVRLRTLGIFASFSRAENLGWLATKLSFERCKEVY